MNNTLWEKLIIYAKQQEGFVNGGSFERVAMNWWIKGKPVKPSNISRRLRELAEVGVLDFKDEGSVWYRFMTCPEILEKAKTLMPLDDKKQSFQARMYKFVGEITISREEEVRRLVNGIA